MSLGNLNPYNLIFITCFLWMKSTVSDLRERNTLRGWVSSPSSPWCHLCPHVPVLTSYTRLLGHWAWWERETELQKCSNCRTATYSDRWAIGLRLTLDTGNLHIPVGWGQTPMSSCWMVFTSFFCVPSEGQTKDVFPMGPLLYEAWPSKKQANLRWFWGIEATKRPCLAGQSHLFNGTLDLQKISSFHWSPPHSLSPDLFTEWSFPFSWEWDCW